MIPLCVNHFGKRNLVTHIFFELCLFKHFSSVANFEQQSLGNRYMICKYHWTGLCRRVWCNSTHFEFSFVKVFREKTPKRSLYLHNPTLVVGRSILGWQTTWHYLHTAYIQCNLDLVTSNLVTTCFSKTIFQFTT